MPPLHKRNEVKDVIAEQKNRNDDWSAHLSRKRGI